MEKQIFCHDQELTYTLKKSSRARRMRLTVHCDGSIIVTTPFGFFQETAAERFVREKSMWVISKLAHFKNTRSKSVHIFTKADFHKYKKDARVFVQYRIKELNTFYKFDYNQISIRDQKTRWGSCSKNGNLSFNYKLLFLPQRLSDYLIVHELCHIQELNHSKKFWNQVARIFPDYKQLRKELKSQSNRLG